MSKNNRTNMLRSTFGGHYAGTGIVQSADMLDDYNIQRGIKVNHRMILPTDRFENDQVAFEAYCQQQSGEVVSYKLEDLTIMD